LEQFLKGKTRTLSTEETGGLDQPDGCEEGPFVNRQCIQAEEPGDGLGKGESEPGKRGNRWAEPGGFRSAAGTAVGSVAARAERGHLSTSAGATTPDPEEGHPQKTRIVHVREGFEFLGYKIKRGQRKLHLPASKIRSQARQGALYAYPKEKSIGRFMDQIRQRTKRGIPLKTTELIEALNPLLRAGASITNAPTSASSSNVLTAGSGDVSGRIGTGVGAMPAGNGCL
jgi:hypothetical protein